MLREVALGASSDHSVQGSITRRPAASNGLVSRDATIIPLHAAVAAMYPSGTAIAIPLLRALAIRSAQACEAARPNARTRPANSDRIRCSISSFSRSLRRPAGSDTTPKRSSATVSRRQIQGLEGLSVDPLGHVRSRSLAQRFEDDVRVYWIHQILRPIRPRFTRRRMPLPGAMTFDNLLFLRD